MNEAGPFWPVVRPDVAAGSAFGCAVGRCPAPLVASAAARGRARPSACAALDEVLDAYTALPARRPHMSSAAQYFEAAW